MLRDLRRPPLGASAGVWCLVVYAATASAASAQTQDTTYEQQRVMQHVVASGRRVDPEPEGKRVRRVILVRRPVFEGDDLLVPVVLPSFAPTWPNTFHWLTEPETIRRELLIREGEPFRAALADESTRNLRGLGILSLVRVVPLATEDEGRVDVLVYTRDLWSLRLEQEFSGAGETFELAAQLVERNFLGRDKSVSGRFSLQQDTFTVGQTYVDPRVFGHALALTESFDVILNRDSGRPEGSTGGLYFGRPFYTLAQRYSFDVNLAYSDFVARDFRAGRLMGYDIGSDPRPDRRCVVGTEDCLARVWDESRLRIDAAVHRRVGERFTMTFTAGFGVFDRSAEPNRETALRPEQQAVFRAEVLPRSRRDVYPFVRYRLSLPRYVEFTNLSTFARIETVQVGPKLDASFTLPLEPLGSTASGLSVNGSIGWVWADDDALLDVVAEGWSRLEREDVLDQRAFLQLRAASPSFAWAFGRFVARWYWEPRRWDSQRTFVALGGDNGLRGYPSQFAFGTGASRMVWNVEYRTRPWLLQSIHLGLVAFYDAGTVYRSVADLHILHSVGAGLRLLFPQFNPTVFRVDVGQPIGEPGFSVLLSYSSDQAIGLTPADDLAASSGLGPKLR